MRAARRAVGATRRRYLRDVERDVDRTTKDRRSTHPLRPRALSRTHDPLDSPSWTRVSGPTDARMRPLWSAEARTGAHVRATAETQRTVARFGAAGRLGLERVMLGSGLVVALLEELAVDFGAFSTGAGVGETSRVTATRAGEGAGPAGGSGAGCGGAGGRASFGNATGGAVVFGEDSRCEGGCCGSFVGGGGPGTTGLESAGTAATASCGADESGLAAESNDRGESELSARASIPEASPESTRADVESTGSIRIDCT